MAKYKSWRVMPDYTHKHDETYDSQENFKKKVFESLILTAAFGAVVYTAIMHDKRESQGIQHKIDAGIEQILK